MTSKNPELSHLHLSQHIMYPSSCWKSHIQRVTLSSTTAASGMIGITGGAVLGVLLISVVVTISVVVSMSSMSMCPLIRGGGGGGDAGGVGGGGAP